MFGQSTAVEVSSYLDFSAQFEQATRALVIDECDGIAHRSHHVGQITVLIELRVTDNDEPIPPRPRFSRLQEWPTLEY